MTDHLAISTLNALVDGELSTDQLASAPEHLAGCQSCTASALSQSLLKSNSQGRSALHNATESPGTVGPHSLLRRLTV